MMMHPRRWRSLFVIMIHVASGKRYSVNIIRRESCNSAKQASQLIVLLPAKVSTFL
ncbi:hypothetical protein HanIR_Chr03g0121331 [Helianthus annuus]|nr:hypothetical protein HanIR_Chr03g0121331 [Helianthus annuus]